VSHRLLRFTLGLCALSACLQLGCGDYTADPAPATAGGAGAATTGGGGAASGSTAMGGSGGSSAGSMTAGSASGGGGAAGGGGGRQDPPPATCTDVTACGGDVVGVWFATSSCLPVTGMADLGDFGIGCGEAPATGKLDVTGNWTLGTDGKISDNTTTTGQIVMEMAAGCLNISGTVSTCDRLSSPLSSVGFSDLTCVDSTTTTGGCTCTGSINQMGSMGLVSFNAAKTGKFTTASNKLTVSSGDKPEYDYCVQGDVLTATIKSKNNIGQVNGTVVFQKQP
jgi:hypothetical protein